MILVIQQIFHGTCHMARPRYLLSIFYFAEVQEVLLKCIYITKSMQNGCGQNKRTTLSCRHERTTHTRLKLCVPCVCACVCLAYVSARAQRKDITTFNNTTKTPEWVDAYKTTNKTCKKTKNQKREAENRSSNNALWPLFFSLYLFC